MFKVLTEGCEPTRVVAEDVTTITAQNIRITK